MSVKCPLCPRYFKNELGVRIHMGMVHKHNYSDYYPDPGAVPKLDEATMIALNRQSNINMILMCNGNIQKMTYRQRKNLVKDGIIKIGRIRFHGRWFTYTDAGKKLVEEALNNE